LPGRFPGVWGSRGFDAKEAKFCEKREGGVHRRPSEALVHRVQTKRSEIRSGQGDSKKLKTIGCARFCGAKNEGGDEETEFRHGTNWPPHSN